MTTTNIRPTFIRHVALSTLFATVWAGAGASSPQFTQAFGPQQQVDTPAGDPRSVHAADLNGDGDLDFLSAIRNANEIAWYPNLGNGSFGAKVSISTNALGARSVYAVDLDGDGRVDVLSASELDNKIAWYKNQGNGMFGGENILTQLALGAWVVSAADMDGDGRVDVLSASVNNSTIEWYPNLGGGMFGLPKPITLALAGISVGMHTADVDLDGDVDVLSASGNAVAWYKNNGAGIFGPQLAISVPPSAASSVFATDIDGDGDVDVLSGNWGGSEWYENIGGEVFAVTHSLSNAAGSVSDVLAADFDGDGDLDVLSSSVFGPAQLAWFENTGAGSFGPLQPIQTAGHFCHAVYAADMDQDGDADILTAEAHPALGNVVAWYGNQMGDPFASYCSGSVLACPCGNAGESGAGCANSSGGGATLDAAGSNSVGADDAVFTTTGLLPGKPALLFSGVTLLNGGAGTPFGDGLRCVGGQITRLQVRIPDGSGAATWGPGVAGAQGWQSGELRTFQVWYRDPVSSPCGGQFNLSNGLSVTYTP